jgi:protein-L-isoaspartate O-methyltransferase
MTTLTRSARSAEIQSESLSRAVNGTSTENEVLAIEAFSARGIPPEDIRPRENVFTFNAWKALGRQVRKGEKSVHLPTRKTCRKKKPDGTDDVYTVPWTAYVFHISQTDPIEGAEQKAPPAVDRSEDDAADVLPAYVAKPRAVTIDTTQAAKLREMAGRMMSEVERLRGDHLENTPKRQREGMARRIEAANLDRAASMMTKAADAIEAGEQTPTGTLTKRDAIAYTAKRTNSSGYYHVAESDEWRDGSHEADRWRSWWMSRATAADTEKAAELAKRDRIKAMEEAVRFSNFPGFFPTPPAIIGQMLEAAGIGPGMSVLEPSAGKGDILDALAQCQGIQLFGVEAVPQLADICTAKGHNCATADFMESDLGQWDRILMNPPFENGQDRAHVMKAYQCLKPGGRVVAVMSAGSFQDGRGKSEWLAFLEAQDHTIEELEDGAFSSAFRQTGVSTRLVVIDKPAAQVAAKPASPGREFLSLFAA